AEIPAFTEIEAIDADANGRRTAAEEGAYASARCEAAHAALQLALDAQPIPLAAEAAPALSFPEGAGGLATLRLECHFAADLGGARSGLLSIADTTDDGHVGWREVTIAARAGVRLADADVPAASPSELLTSYPTDRLESPPDVRHGSARFAPGAGSSTVAAEAGVPPLAPTAGDPLGALVGADLSPQLAILALLLAAGLGAAHAVSPGHGKTLVAAYLVGSRGTVRQALGLGVTVAATHTAGVLVLGVLVLAGGQLLLPETAIGWLTVVSGALTAVLGLGLVFRALRTRPHSHGHDRHHDHDHRHAHPHPHPHGSELSVRGVALLGVAGGLVPSASALIVLLAAITTGRLAFGLALIGAFGVGMALVLGGIAVATTLAREWLGRHVPGEAPAIVRRAARLVPIGSGMLVLGIGLVLAVTAVARLG
ncbi:MAG TPA: sulfite exporter TauE/SafE family protein, partial [Candidatus Limnocylindria bacterium]|nr:sulfite exporter TauE/SafE family protein [Candidatus Limnocylindria bacterium]